MSTTPAPRSVRRPFHLRPSVLGALLLALACLVLYEPGGFENTSGDNISIRYLGVSILKHGTIMLDPVKKDLEGVRFAAIYLSNGSWVPRTSFGLIPLVVPVFAVADWTHLYGSEWTHDRISRVARVTGIVWATATVVCLYLFLLRLVPPPAALLSALMFATGTWNWSMGALGAGLQVGTILLLTLNLHATWRLCTSRTRGEAEIAALLLGALHAWVLSVRPQDVFLLVPIGLLVFERRVLLPYAIPFVGALTLVGALQRVYYLNWMGMYGVINGGPLYRNTFSGVAGLLASPNYGAVVFFPLLFLVPYLWWRLMRPASPVALARAAWAGRVDAAISPMERFSLVLAIGSVLYFLSTASLDFWHGAWAYGPRYLYDLQPYAWVSIGLGTAALLDRSGRVRPRLGPIVSALFVWCALQGTVIHGLGFRNFDMFIWNQAHVPMTDAATWETKDWVIADTWRAGSSEGRWPDALHRLQKEGF